MAEAVMLPSHRQVTMRVQCLSNYRHRVHIVSRDIDYAVEIEPAPDEDHPVSPPPYPFTTGGNGPSDRLLVYIDHTQDGGATWNPDETTPPSYTPQFPETPRSVIVAADDGQFSSDDDTDDGLIAFPGDFTDCIVQFRWSDA